MYRYRKYLFSGRGARLARATRAGTRRLRGGGSGFGGGRAAPRPSAPNRRTTPAALPTSPFLYSLLQDIKTTCLIDSVDRLIQHRKVQK